jgi:1-acyl-sn-glycerol-3-phosphate acyltransferase
MAEVVYPPVIRVALGLFRALDLRFDVVGTEHVPASGGGVVVINHTGYLDFAIAGVPFWHAHRRLVRFMAKEQVFRHPVSGPLMRGMKHIPVDRSAGSAAYAAAVTALRSGELVGVFPEATISRSFTLKEFKTGAARMALEADVPLLPLVIWGSQRIWTKGRARSARAARHLPLCITLGAPLVAAAGEDAAALTQRLGKVMDDLLEETRGRYPDAPRGENDRWWLPAHLGGTAPTREQARELDAQEAVRRAAAKTEKAARGGKRAAS